MGKCLPCSSVSSGEKGLIRKFKRLYEQGKTERYVYRLEKGGSIFLTDKKSFPILLETKIKPNFDKGAEYFHISEFKF